jgi:hypothetical protein
VHIDRLVMQSGMCDCSPYQRKQHMGQCEENVWDQEARQHISLPICAVQYQEVPALEENMLSGK